MGGSRPIRALRIARGSALDARSRVATSCTACASPLPTSCARSRRPVAGPTQSARLALSGADRRRHAAGRHTPGLALSGAALHAAERRDRAVRRPAGPLGGSCRPAARGAPGHRQPDSPGSCWSPPAPTRPGCAAKAPSPCWSARHHPSLVGQDRAPAPEPCRRPPGQLRALHACVEPHVPRPAHPAYVRRRTAEGKTKPQIIRCLKRYPGCRRSGSPVRRLVRSSARPRDGRGCVPGSRPPRSSRCRRLGSV